MLHIIAVALANKRLLLIVMLSLFMPAESFAETRIVDSRYIELTGVDYFLWTQGALPPEALCASVGILTMKASPYLDAEHCFCADTSRFSEQPNLPTEPGEPAMSVLFLAYGDQDGDPVVCPWEAINDPPISDPPDSAGPDGSASGSGVESELGPGGETAAGGVPPEDLEQTGSCMSVSANNCQFSTGQQCADKNTNNEPGAPWQWCGASPTNLCRNEYIEQPPFELHVCN